MLSAHRALANLSLSHTYMYIQKIKITSHALFSLIATEKKAAIFYCHVDTEELSNEMQLLMRQLKKKRACEFIIFLLYSPLVPSPFPASYI